VSLGACRRLKSHRLRTTYEPTNVFGQSLRAREGECELGTLAIGKRCQERISATGWVVADSSRNLSAIPFGFTANELIAWVQYGGGQELWDALSGQFNIKSPLCTSTGCQMGGWFAREITSPEQCCSAS
jgi:hypothetical protein